MAGKYKILILDDEQDLLELYQELLSRMPSQPEIHTANTGARAMALLESDHFSLLLTDLNMPTMDGFQILSIVRRKFPGLRTVVMTSVTDEQFRARSYSLGIDLYLEKPRTPQEIQLFTDCVESLLEREELGGFRGVQSKSLVDLIQLECLSQSSAVLKITNKNLEARIWILNGEVIDASLQDLTGEDAFKRILGWKTGNFEILQADPARTRTIFNSYQGLLLDTAQAIDEADATGAAAPSADGTAAPTSNLARIGRARGVEFAISVPIADSKKFEAWALENPENMAAWVQKTMNSFRGLGEKLLAGNVKQVEGMGAQRHVAMISRADADLCVGFQRAVTQTELRESMKDVATQWVS